MAVKTRLDKDKVVSRVRAASVQPLEKCAILLEAESKKLLNVKGQQRTSATGQSSPYSNQQKTSYIPSAPGEPPHKDTSNLFNSIQYALTAIGTYVVGPTLTAFYGAVHEFGGVNHPPRPFMRPALENCRKKFAELFKDLPLGGSAK